ncbi:hypothetical protein N752_01790 [Desulforamulus aquiferis]|nr:hypothetical protein [Desulforamulus aquiferis]RYD06885.1 hypothetical protein N752_01790 [Desulforamulus aquiferis]
MANSSIIFIGPFLFGFWITNELLKEKLNTANKPETDGEVLTVEAIENNSNTTEQSSLIDNLQGYVTEEVKPESITEDLTKEELIVEEQINEVALTKESFDEELATRESIVVDETIALELTIQEEVATEIIDAEQKLDERTDEEINLDSTVEECELSNEEISETVSEDKSPVNESAQTLLAQGLLFRKGKDFPSAIRCYKKSIALKPTSELLYLVISELSSVYQQLGLYSMASV